MPTNNEPTGSPTRTNSLAAYLAANTTIDVPRWKLYLLILLGIVVGDAVENFLESRYPLSRPAVFLLSFVAVIAVGSSAGILLKRKSRRDVS
jgi:hypothetical protein